MAGLIRAGVKGKILSSFLGLGVTATESQEGAVRQEWFFFGWEQGGG